MGTEINGLTWRINSTNRVSYNPIDNTEQNIPLNLAPPLPNATVNIFNATRISDNSIDVVSTLNLLDVSYIRESLLIECSSSDITRNTTSLIRGKLKILHSTLDRITRDSYIVFLAPPLSTSSTPCSLLLPPGGPMVSLQWSLSFTSLHDVERYRVVVTNDPPSCSSQHVSPSEDYTCSGLVLGTDYSFKVSAINCGNQEGTRETFTIQPQGIIMVKQHFHLRM